jgi:3-methylfumaryl-CoA hydratase
VTPSTPPNRPEISAAAPASDADLARWIGRSETLHDRITPMPVIALAATLDHPAAPVQPGDLLPLLWHWLYFLPMHRQSEVGPDGHPRRGGFLPPVPLPRRMWAGSQFEFRAPLRVGDAVSRSSTIEDVSTKHGRSGTLVFVKVRHDLFCNGSAEPALVEFQDIVYRDVQQPGAVAPAPQAAAASARWQRAVVPDSVLLFRYSALTFNGHRIHYDRPYATGVEGYPGLVVHGPLIATLLMDLLQRELPGADVASFRFKAVRPTFDLNSFRVSAEVLDDPEASAATAALERPSGGRTGGKTVHLWAHDHEGWLTMDATATLR